MWRKKINKRDVSFFIGGMLILTLGIRIISMTSLGLAFSDALFIKISEIFNISLSLSSLILGIFTLLVASIIERKRIKIECLISSYILGLFTGLWTYVIPAITLNGLFLNILGFLVGVFVLSVGVSIYLQPEYPPHPNDFLFMQISKRFKTNLFLSKVMMDFGFGIFAILIKAPIGIGSIFNTFCLGFFINRLYSIFKKIYAKNKVSS